MEVSRWVGSVRELLHRAEVCGGEAGVIVHRNECNLVQVLLFEGILNRPCPTEEHKDAVVRRGEHFDTLHMRKF